MGIRAGLTVSLLGAALALSQAAPAIAQSDAWDTCIATATRPDDRVTSCTTVIDARSESGKKLAAAYCNRGHGFTEKRELDRALADLDEAIRIDAAYPCAYTNRGRVYAFKRDLDRAMADYNEAIRIDPTFALAYNNRGDAFVGKGDIERALADFNAAIKYNPSLAIAYGNRGYLYYRKRDMVRAIADYTTQIRLAPDVLAYINRGNAYRDSEQLDRAIADYAEVIRIAPSDARGWRNRGMIRLYRATTRAGSPTTTRRCNTTPLTCSPGTTAAKPNCGLATSRARSRISARRWSFARISTPRARVCSGLARRNSRFTLSAARHSPDASRSSL